MEFPGITKKAVEQLEPKVQKIVRKHLDDVKAVIKEKENIFKNKDPNEKFFGFKGFKQLDTYASKSKGKVKKHLADLKTTVNALKASIDQEIALVKDLDMLAKDSKKDDTVEEELQRLKGQIDDELFIARQLQQQMGYINDIHHYVADISKLAGKEIVEYVVGLDNIAGILRSKIEKELEYLELIYNFLNIPGWEDLKAEFES